MTTLAFFQVDAFTPVLFGGNPAGVVVLEAPLEPARMQSIAAENNLPETAFVLAREDGYDIRWFSPAVEVPFCGHATLATAHVLYTAYAATSPIRFFADAAPGLSVRRGETGYVLNVPRRDPVVTTAPPVLIELFPDQTVLVAEENYLIELASAEAVRDYAADFRRLLALAPYGLVITARGEDCDFVSRYFWPAGGIDEDPATGSTHAALAPYWGQKLGKTTLVARQISKRGGRLVCTLSPNRVEIEGQAVTYLQGAIHAG